MEIETHAPSRLVLGASLTLALLALLSHFFLSAEHIDKAFWFALMAFVALALGSVIKS